VDARDIRSGLTITFWKTVSADSELIIAAPVTYSPRLFAGNAIEAAALLAPAALHQSLKQNLITPQ